MSEFTITKIQNKKLSQKIRLYFISKNKHYFINHGKLTDGFESNISLDASRENILDAYSKITFLFDELIRLRIIGYIHDSKSKELLYLLNLIPVNRKIRLFLDWKVFDPQYTKIMSRLFEVRNDIIHCIDISDVLYNPKTSISLGTKKGFTKFKNDLQKSWKQLILIYVVEQNKIDLKKLTKDLLL